MRFYLESPRLILRSFRPADLDSFLAYRSDPLVAQYQGWEIPYPREKAEAFIEEMSQQNFYPSVEWFQVALELRETGAMIGDCAFHLLETDQQQAEIGFSLARAYWGFGYGTEAIQRLLAYLFEEVKLHRVIANCDPRNLASSRLLERVGMRRQAHHIQSYYHSGEYTDEAVYAILRREYQEQHP